ncbi:MAG TPA: 3'-5' exonuclease, partial [Solirubrobacteraceae bacterium]|nr:3'-5' exonuclease [Solirubrobacteraceae bacterium]
IYGFRHADVRLFEERRRALAPQGATAALATSFRSRPEILAALNAAFHDAHGPHGWVPLLPAREPDPDGGPLVEVLLTDAEAWERGEDTERDALLARGLPDAAPERQAEARLVAQRVAELVAGGVKQSEVVVLLRATTDIALYERALELAGLETLAAGGRGWWARQQVQDLCAWLAALANPRDEPALLGVLASPLVGVSSDALALLALAARRGGRPLWETLAAAFCGAGEDPAGLLARLGAADRERLEAFCGRFAAERALAPRLGLDELIGRAVRATGYDLHVAALPGGRRRLANVHKLMRLAAGFEARRGRDVRAFVDLATAELDADAREADAPVDLGGQEAVRLMSIHAAKGLEFGVVVLADLGRRGNETHADLLVDGERIGLRVLGLDGCSEPALEFEALRLEQRERECEEERRVMHVALTRAENRLILAGAVRLGDGWPGGEPRTAPPMSWIGPALVPAIAELTGDEPDQVHELERGGWSYAVRTVLSTPATGVVRLDAPVVGSEEQLALEVGRAQAAGFAAEPPRAQPPPVPAGLSYSALSSHAQCGYRFYLERILRMPRQDPPAHLLGQAPPAEGIDLLLRGTLVHELLERTDLRGEELPGADDVRDAGRRHDVELSGAEVEDLLCLLAGFDSSPLRARLRAATSLAREHVFAFLLEAGDESGPLLNGVVDVLAQEGDGTALVVDYKSDHVDGADLEELVERAYGTQRRIYALAALRAGAPAVEVVHLFLTRPQEPVSARYRAADAPALERELHSRAAGVLAGQYPVSETPHRGLCATCPGRNGLCRWGPDMTDRELDRAAT